MSKLDADKYRLNINDIISFTKDKTHKEIMESVGLLAVATSVPIIIVLTYIGELYGFTPDVLAYIERLKEFYKIDEVLNVKKEIKEEKEEN